MSLFRRDAPGQSADQVIPRRAAATSPHVDGQTALRHSAVWACLRLRADLISTMPVDVFRRLPNGAQVEVPKPPVLIEPGGSKVYLPEWLYSSQFDLDRYGNSFGLITAVDSMGLPARVELAAAADVGMRVRRGKVEKYRFGSEWFDPAQVWHERQYTVAGLPVGLSPIAYAAWSIGGFLAAQGFVHDWFTNGRVPRSKLKNVAKVIQSADADAVKARYSETVANGDVFVHGSDWDLEMMAVPQAEADFLATMKFGIPDVCRFLGVPGDMVDAESSTGHITYANVTQRNLQLLILNLGPSIIRRETALSGGLLPKPRYLKFNTDALLRMDPKAAWEQFGVAIDKRFMAPSEVRELINRMPFTADQLAEFDRLFPHKPTPTKTGPTS